jgi:hypothetical protein
MAAVLLLTPVLFVLLMAVAAAPAAAAPRLSDWKLQTVEAGNFDRPARNRHDPVLGRVFDPVFGRQLLPEESEALPAWTLPFGTSAGERAEERGRRGLSFRVRPGHGLKAMARLRF